MNQLQWNTRSSLCTIDCLEKALHTNNEMWKHIGVWGGLSFAQYLLILDCWSFQDWEGIVDISTSFYDNLNWKTKPFDVSCWTSVQTKWWELTYYVHEGENIILHVLLAVEAHHRVVHGQQHLDVVVVFLRVPPLALGFWQLLLDEIQSRGEVRDPEVRHCEDKTAHKQVSGQDCGNRMHVYFFSYFSSREVIYCTSVKLYIKQLSPGLGVSRWDPSGVLTGAAACGYFLSRSISSQNAPLGLINHWPGEWEVNFLMLHVRTNYTVCAFRASVPTGSHWFQKTFSFCTCDIYAQHLIPPRFSFVREHFVILQIQATTQTRIWKQI